VSSVMHINPVMTLIILYIAHSLMGFWGMLLGVPIAVYIWRNISMPRHGKPRAERAPESEAAVRRGRAWRRPGKARRSVRRKRL
ncbi:MAG: AI-2E family transporter, partial [Mailhella sp.]|nr:AI-2E family transporter [Mailhella sp.]